MDDEAEIELIKQDILDALKKYSYIDLGINKFILDELENDKNLKSKKKDIMKLVNDMYNVINGLGEIKYNDDEIKQVIGEHCKHLGLNFKVVHDRILSAVKEKYLCLNEEFFSIMREKLQKLSSLVQGSRLRQALAECFKVKREVPYDRIRFLYTNILKDKYVYTVHKNNPSCEHVVPRKFFNQEKPMNADMHHLFLAPSNVNTTRDVKKFSTLSGKAKYIDDKGNIKKSSASNMYTDTNFYPEPYSRGRIARACAYFFSIYPDCLESISNTIDIEDMKEWCKKYKPSTYEFKRNWFIFQIQRNINPYAIYPKLIDHAFLDLDENFAKRVGYEKKIVHQINAIQKQMNFVDDILSEYIDVIDDPEGQIKASYILIQAEKIKSSLTSILKNINVN